MKKNILLFFLILFSSISLKAQLFAPITWKITSSEINGNNEMTITFRAGIEKGWHVYGTDLPKDGPLPTTFVFEKLKNAETIGLPVSNSKLIKKY